MYVYANVCVCFLQRCAGSPSLQINEVLFRGTHAAKGIYTIYERLVIITKNKQTKSILKPDGSSFQRPTCQFHSFSAKRDVYTKESYIDDVAVHFILYKRFIFSNNL